MEAEEFLLARMGDLDDIVKDYGWLRDHFGPLIDSQRVLIKAAMQWPILVEEPAETTVFDDFDTLKVNYQITRRYDWVLREVYTKQFGEAPFSPVIRHMLELYRDHKDFEERWLV